jgi:hypothetical protein
MADRCYLALAGPRGDSELLESEFAAQLNIGLIRVGPGYTCEIILSSPQHRPLRAQKLALIRQLKFIECAVCGNLRPASTIILGRIARTRFGLPLKKGKVSVLLSNIDSAPGEHGDERRYLCRDCVHALSGA